MSAESSTSAVDSGAEDEALGEQKPELRSHSVSGDASRAS